MAFQSPRTANMVKTTLMRKLIVQIFYAEKGDKWFQDEYKINVIIVNRNAFFSAIFLYHHNWAAILQQPNRSTFQTNAVTFASVASSFVSLCKPSVYLFLSKILIELPIKGAKIL